MQVILHKVGGPAGPSKPGFGLSGMFISSMLSSRPEQIIAKR